MSNYFINGQAGNDSNSGSEGSPWRNLAAIKRSAKAGDTVILADGVYHEPLPLVSGLTVKARNPGAAIVDGSGSVTVGWQKASNGIWSAAWSGPAPMGLFFRTYALNGPFCCAYDGRYAQFDPTRPNGAVTPGSKSQWMLAGGRLQVTTPSGGNPNEEGLVIATGDGAISLDGLSDVHLDGIVTRYWRYSVGSKGGRNIQLSGCRFGYAAQTNTWLTGIDGAELTGCVIEGGGSMQAHAEDCLHMEGGRVKLSGVDVSYGGHGCMFVQNGGALTVVSSYFHDSGGSGITLVRNVNGAVIEGCWFERCATQRTPSVRDVGSAIQMHGNKHRITNSVFRANSKHFLLSATGPSTDNPTTSDNLVDHCTLLDAEENGVEMQEAAPAGEIARNIFRACVIKGAGLDLLSCWFAGVGRGSAGASNHFEGSQITGGRIRGTAGTFPTVEAARTANPLVYLNSQSSPIPGAGSSLTAPPAPGGGGGGNGGNGGGGGNGGTVPTKPVLVKLEPSTVDVGDTVTGEGALFGSNPILVMQTRSAAGAVSAARVPLSSADDKRVTWKVPLNGATGPVYVRNTQLQLTTNSLVLTVGGSVPLPNKPPVANAGGPYQGVVGTSLTLDGSQSSDPDGSVVSWQWSFGDGEQSQAVGIAKMGHVYARAGAYAVVLTVRDNQGAQATTQTTAYISPPPPQPGPLTVTIDGFNPTATGASFIGRVTDTAPLPAGSAISITAKHADGRVGVATATIGGTPPEPLPPIAPSACIATPSGTRIEVTWRDNSGDETGFQVQRKTSGEFALLRTVPANVTTLVDEGLVPGTTYIYRVRAANAVAFSDWSNEAGATVVPVPPADNSLDQVFQFNGPASDVALLRGSLARIFFPWGKLLTEMQRRNIQRIVVEFADLSQYGAMLTVAEDPEGEIPPGTRLQMAAIEEEEDDEHDHTHVLWSDQIAGNPNEPLHYVAGLAWSSGKLQVEEKLKSQTATVDLIVSAEVGHMADFFWLSAAANGDPNGAQGMHTQLLALTGETLGWWHGSYSDLYFQQAGENWMAGFGIAYSDFVGEDHRFTHWYLKSQAADIRRIVKLARTDGKT